MGSELKLLLTGQGGARDATALLQSCTWSGSIGQVGRTLDFSLVSSPMDKNLPVVPCDLGSGVQFYCGAALLFDGYVFSRQRDTAGTTIEIGCLDRGIYLKRNQAAYKFRHQTPEAITRTLCGDFDIPVGALAQTGVPITRNFPGTSLYQMIQTAYTLAAERTGEKYVTRFCGDKLEVLSREQGPSTLVLLAGSNLIRASVTESAENMVNQVVIYDGAGNRVSKQSEREAIKLYGLMQGYLKQAKGRDSEAEAKRLLAEGGVSQKVTTENLGNSALITGGCVVLREEVTGLYGLFWIDADAHTWKNGLYQNKLTLSFRKGMDEQEAGSLQQS